MLCPLFVCLLIHAYSFLVHHYTIVLYVMWWCLSSNFLPDFLHAFSLWTNGFPSLWYALVLQIIPPLLIFFSVPRFSYKRICFRWACLWLGGRWGEYGVEGNGLKGNREGKRSRYEGWFEGREERKRSYGGGLGNIGMQVPNFMNYTLA